MYPTVNRSQIYRVNWKRQICTRIHKVWCYWLRDMIFRSVDSGTSTGRREDICGTRAIFDFCSNSTFCLSSPHFFWHHSYHYLPIFLLQCLLSPSLSPKIPSSRFNEWVSEKLSIPWHSKFSIYEYFSLGNGSIAFIQFSERSVSRKLKIQEKKIFIEYV